MRTKKFSKLAINKKTVANLDATDLNQVKGGATHTWHYTCEGKGCESRPYCSFTAIPC